MIFKDDQIRAYVEAAFQLADRYVTVQEKLLAFNIERDKRDAEYHDVTMKKLSEIQPPTIPYPSSDDHHS